MALGAPGRRPLIRVRDVMVRSPVTVELDATVEEAAKLMQEYNVGCLPVVNGEERPVGIITEGDIVRRVVARGLKPRKVLVREVMSPNPITVREDAALDEAVDAMLEHNIGHVIVVDSSGRVVGLVADADIARLVPELLSALRECSGDGGAGA